MTGDHRPPEEWFKFFHLTHPIGLAFSDSAVRSFRVPYQSNPLYGREIVRRKEKTHTNEQQDPIVRLRKDKTVFLFESKSVVRI